MSTVLRDLNYYILLISDFELIFGLYYLSTAISVIKDPRYRKLKIHRLYAPMCLGMSIYCFLAFLFLIFEMPEYFRSVIAILASLPVFTSQVYYVKTLKVFLGFWKGRGIHFIERACEITLLISFVDVFLVLLFPPSKGDGFVNYFLQTVAGSYWAPLHTRILFSIQALILILSAIYLFNRTLRERSHERLILFGIALTCITALSDIFLEFSRYAFPLAPLGYLPETLRIKKEINSIALSDNETTYRQMIAKATYSKFAIILSSIAHDIAPPLRILRDLVGSSEKGQRAIEFIRRNVHSHNENYLSSASRTELFLSDIVEKLRMLFKNQMSEKGTYFLNSISKGAKVIGDEAHLFIILENLISNSIKANAQQITVCAEVGREQLRLTVKDDGNGFRKNLPPEKEEALRLTDFIEPGHGLSIVNQVVQEELGKMWLSHGPEGHTLVNVELPIFDS